MSKLRSFGPAVAHVSATEAVRAGVGAFFGLALAGLFVLLPPFDADMGLYLIAPFGASSVLLFAVPNSPLAQPWSAIVGNTVAAVVGVAVCLTVSDPVLRVALAVGLAVVTTILCRAAHPPAGAVAMTAALNPDAISHLGFWFALTPVGVGTTFLVSAAIVYARLTGRRYPFRQFDDPSKHRTQDRNPTERLSLSKQELGSILEGYGQTYNLGIEDLARLIGAAELQAAAHSSGVLIAEAIMSRPLVTVSADTEILTIANLFMRHRFTSLPVVGADGKFLGIIYQIHLISQARSDALRLKRSYFSAFARMVDQGWARPRIATEIMSVGSPRATMNTPIAALLPLMADGEVEAIPVLKHGRLAGIVTQTDLIAALAHSVTRKA